MIVCICRRVSDHDIRRAARSGCASFDALQQQLGVATGCGACGDCALHTFEQAQAGRSDVVRGRTDNQTARSAAGASVAGSHYRSVPIVSAN